MKKILQNRLFFSVYFLFFLLLCFTLSPMHTSAQEGTRQIKGMIFSETGAPLDGAVVQIKGAKTSGVTTNASGSFSIQVPSGYAVLVFSMVGYEKKELPVGNNLQLSVQLQALNSSIGEVVVVGYGTQKKETLSGSVASIKSSEINTTKSTSVVSNIQGKVPGVHIRQQTAEPGTFNSLVSIRGFGTPLLVIDGVPRDGMSDFERLNPEDIENISVLKDAAAAIYGMNSDNGVIIVTTKRGSRGKAKFNYNGFYGTKQPTAMLKNVDAYTYRTIKNEMNANTKLAAAFTQTELDKWKAGTEKGFQDYDWFKETIRPFTAQSQHNLSVSGGNDQVTYYSSLGILADDGILKSDIQQYRKYNFRTNVTFNMSEDLKATITFAGRVDNNKSPQGSYFWFFKPLIIADRAYTPFLLDKPGLVSLIPPESTNPYALAEESISGYEKWNNVQYQTNLELSYNVRAIKGLKLGFLGAYDGNTYNWSNLQRSYYQYNYITAAPTLRGQNKLTNNITNLARTNMQVSANYKRSIANNHNIAATAVFEMRSIKTDILSATRQYDDVYTTDVINQGSLTNALNGGDRILQRYMSTLGRINYDFKSKYLLEMAFRNDGSYRYAPNKRWAFFPSASVGWRASEESFIKKALPFVSNLKFRGSYGLMGADAGNAFEYFSGYKFSSIDWGYVFNNNVLTMGMAPPGVVNDNLTWVKTKTANFGVDISLWQGKLNITADVFQKNRDGLLANRIQSVPNTFGASFPQENINSDKVRGFELMIGHKGKLGKLNYDVSANMTYARKYLIYSERAPYQSTWEKWKDVWGSDRILGREWGYLHDGRYTNITEYQNAPLLGGTLGNSMHLPGSRKITDVNGDGIINGNDQMPAFWSGQYQSFAGNPPLQFGMNFNFSYKSFDMNMLFQGASLFTVFASPNDVWGYGRYPNLWEKFLDRWRLEDPKMNPYDPAAKWIPGEYPALRSNFNNTTDGLTTDIWRMNATYLRLKSLEIGYTLPAKLVKKAGIQNLRMYVNGFNLFTFSNKYIKGLDPEREEGAYTADLTYPLMRSFNFGLNLNF